MSNHISNPSVIWKHRLPLNEALESDGLIKVKMPTDAQIIKFSSQNEGYCIWEVHTALHQNDLYEHTFWFTGTGQEIPGWLLILNHVGSIQENYFVWHLFEVSDQRNNMEPTP